MGAGSSRGRKFLLHGFSHRESGRLLHPARFKVIKVKTEFSALDRTRLLQPGPQRLRKHSWQERWWQQPPCRGADTAKWVASNCYQDWNYPLGLQPWHALHFPLPFFLDFSMCLCHVLFSHFFSRSKTVLFTSFTRVWLSDWSKHGF